MSVQVLLLLRDDLALHLISKGIRVHIFPEALIIHKVIMYDKWSRCSCFLFFFVFLSGCLMFPWQCTSSSDAPVWQEHQDVACKRKRRVTPSFGQLSASHDGRLCVSLHGVISRDRVSTNISLYCLWTKKIFVIFSAFFLCSLSMFLNGGRRQYKVYIFAIRLHLF